MFQLLKVLIISELDVKDETCNIKNSKGKIYVS